MLYNKAFNDVTLVCYGPKRLRVMLYWCIIDQTVSGSCCAGVLLTKPFLGHVVLVHYRPNHFWVMLCWCIIDQTVSGSCCAGAL